MVRLTEHEAVARDGAAAAGRERPQALAQEDVVHPARSTANTSPAWRTCSTSTPKPPDPKRPVVCFDESPTQLIGEVRQPIPPSRASRTLRLRVSPQRHRQSVRLPRRASALAQGEGHRAAHGRRLRRLHARTRSMSTIPRPSGSGWCWTICRPTRPARSMRPSRRREARRLLRRLEFHYTPKHASWLNMVEIEIGVLRGQCLDRRIDTQRAARRRNRRLGTAAQCRRRPHQMDVHNRKGPHQDGAAPIPTRRYLTSPMKKS